MLSSKATFAIFLAFATLEVEPPGETETAVEAELDTEDFGCGVGGAISSLLLELDTSGLLGITYS